MADEKPKGLRWSDLPGTFQDPHARRFTPPPFPDPEPQRESQGPEPSPPSDGGRSARACQPGAPVAASSDEGPEGETDANSGMPSQGDRAEILRRTHGRSSDGRDRHQT